MKLQPLPFLQNAAIRKPLARCSHVSRLHGVVTTFIWTNDLVTFNAVLSLFFMDVMSSVVMVRLAQLPNGVTDYMTVRQNETLVAAFYSHIYRR